MKKENATTFSLSHGAFRPKRPFKRSQGPRGERMRMSTERTLTGLDIRRALQHRDLAELQRLFPDGPTSAVWTQQQETLMHFVAESSSPAIREWLSTYPLEVNVASRYGLTPLMVAGAYPLGRHETFEWLLAHGADPNAADWFGATVLHYVCCCSWAKGVELLLKAGADPDARTVRGRLPDSTLSHSCRSDTQEEIRELFRAARQPGGCGLK
jgi:hypothetical protein